MANLRKSIDDLKTEKDELLKKVSEAEKALALLEIESKEVKHRLESELGKNARLEASLKELEMKTHEQTKRRSTLISQCQDFEAQIQSLLKEVLDLKNTSKKQSEAMAAQEDVLSQKSKQVRMLELERDELKSQVESTSKSLLQNQEELGHLKTSNQKLTSELHEKSEHLESVLCQMEQITEEKEATEKSNAELTETITALQKRQELDAVKIEGLIKKLSEVMNGTVTSPKASSPTSPLSMIDKKLARTKMAEMKAYEQQINHEVAKRAALESELNAVKNAKQVLENELGDLRKQLEHRRGSATLQRTGSMVSFSSKFKSYLPFGIKFSHFSAALTTFLGSYEGVNIPSIQGWLKMRILKERRNKYEWVKRYMVLRDDKVFLLEKEKDKDSSASPCFIDLRHSVLVIRAVRPNELIHLSEREISCAFMLQFVNYDNKDMSFSQLVK